MAPNVSDLKQAAKVTSSTSSSATSTSSSAPSTSSSATSTSPSATSTSSSATSTSSYITSTIIVVITPTANPNLGPDSVPSLITSEIIVTLPPASTSPIITANPNPKKFESGTVAGIAVGTAFAGAILAGLIVFFCMAYRYRNSRERRPVFRFGGSHHAKTVDPKPETSERRQSNGRKHSQRHQTSDLDKILSQPWDDETMAEEYRRFRTAVDDHVENFYHEQPVQKIIILSEQPNLPLGITTQKEVDFEQLLANPETRFPAISSFICAKVLDTITPTGDPQKSLLPPMVAKFLHEIPKQHTDSHEYQISLSRWRTSTSFLLKLSSEQKVTRDPDRNIQTLVQELDVILGLFVLPDKADNRRADLVALSKRGERLSLNILAQPAVWEFEWNIEQKVGTDVNTGKPTRLRKPLVIFPAFLRTTDNKLRKVDGYTVQPKLLK